MLLAPLFFAARGRRLAIWLALLLGALGPVAGQGHEVIELPKLVQSNEPQFQLASQGGGALLFRIVLPIGAARFQIDTDGGKGDCDLYVRRGAHPEVDKYDRSSEGNTNLEHIQIGRPTPGVWYILLYPAKNFTGLRLRASYERDPEGDSVPKLLPGPGTFPGQARVQLKTPLVGGTVRYTTDGTDPTPSSPRYRDAVVITADTELRAQTYMGQVPRGPVLRAPYRVIAPLEVTPLQSGVVIPHRAGMLGSKAFYRITVPAGMETLQVITQGANGPVTLFLRYGEAPTPREYDFKNLGTNHRTALAVDHPVAGDWYVLVQGRSNFSGLFLQAVHRTAAADLTVWPGSLGPYESTETFLPSDCAVQENLISAGTHRLLRFTTESRNVGGGDLTIGSPIGDPNFQFFECHGHYHFKGFASYLLRDQNGLMVATGRKVSFCLEDVLRWDRSVPLGKLYNCDFQGIQVGWSDIYDSGLPGQWIDITGVAAGDYTLEVTVNPEGILEEADYTNNTATIAVRIP